jgi:hypothetical protein
MGYEYEVYIWTGREYIPYWSGDNFHDAHMAMQHAANEGARCIKLEWRPRDKPGGGE